MAGTRRLSQDRRVPAPRCLTQTWRGVGRHHEDRAWCRPAAGLFAVLDDALHYGPAADLAIGVLEQHLDSIVEAAADDDAATAALRRAVESANATLFESVTAPDYAVTTLSCALLTARSLLVAHVGDSRIYVRRRSGDWTPVTTDHSLIAQLRAQGRVEDLESLIQTHGTVVTRLLGFAASVEIDLLREPAEAFDDVLLCTDGAWRPLDPALSGQGPAPLRGHELLRWMQAQHEADGRRDDATVVLVDRA